MQGILHTAITSILSRGDLCNWIMEEEQDKLMVVYCKLLAIRLVDYA
jgi:hypothetical protein